MEAGIPLKVIKEPKAGSRTVLSSGKQRPAIQSEGPHSYTCGVCGLVLLKNVAAGQVENVVIKCGSCRAFNEV